MYARSNLRSTSRHNIARAALSFVLGLWGGEMLQADSLPATPAPDRQSKPALAVPVATPVPRRVYWGDTHLHTRNSLDAGLFGCGLGPEDAFRFARGDRVISSTGLPAKLSRPYDFLVVTDHSDYMGLVQGLEEGSPELLADPTGKRWYEMYHRGNDGEKWLLKFAVVGGLSTGNRQVKAPGLAKTAWAASVRAADAYNDPGRFTALIGYEWTSTPGGDNLHRNIVFRDGGDKALQVLPLTTFETQDPEKLWQWMADYEAKTGGKVLAIPHNSNLSGGRMFADLTFAGRPFDRQYAEARSAREPLVEIAQSKGDSETDPSVSPDDDFSNFERWDKNNIFNTRPATPEQQPYNYIRPTLTRGLAYLQNLGANPFKFGFVAGTDSHTALSTVDADNFFGNRPRTEPPVNVVAARESPSERWAGNIMSAGLTAVWAPENTRAALFDAFRKKEVYATTGPRITVRVFAGWNFKPADLRREDFVEYGYKHGVPMGGDLVSPGKGDIPIFLILAAKDPDEANLDRIQVIKGWVDARNETHEAIYEAAWSAGRVLDPKGHLPAVGNTVDIARATYTNEIGAPTLCVVWRDPEFDASQPAYYYLRVIEIPTPRWSTYDSARYGVPLPKNEPASLAQRAYTSPIWYIPK